MDIVDVLKDLNINYELVHHKAVFTSEEAQFICNLIDGVGCKNLFLTNHHGKYYLIFLNDNKKGDIKAIKKLVHESNLSFASAEELKAVLNITPGSVTPLAIKNDLENKVTVIIDHNLKNKKVLCHLHDNTETASLSLDDLIKFIEYTGHEFIYDE